MPALSPTHSLEDNLSSQTPRVGPESQDVSTPSPPPKRQDSARKDRPIGTANRTFSHSLLQDTPNNLASSRKSRCAETGTVGGSAARASLSMPSPASKPSMYRQAHSRPQPGIVGSPSSTDSRLKMDGAKDPAAVDDPIALDEPDKMSDPQAPSVDTASDPQSLTTTSNLTLKPPSTASSKTGDRRSFVSLYSLGSAVHDLATGAPSAPHSAASSSAGSVKASSQEQQSSLPLVPGKSDITSSATTATDPINIPANAKSIHQGEYFDIPKSSPLASAKSMLVPTPSSHDGSAPTQGNAPRNLDAWNTGPISRPSAPRRSRSKTKGQRQPSGSTVTSSATSPNSTDRAKLPRYGKVGVCALDAKARSKACRNILTRLSGGNEFDVIIFGDKVILDEEVLNWPKCDFLISFFSDGFPLDKAIEYCNLRKPFCINDLPMQKILWDRRICLRVLDSMGVPTPKRIEVNRDGGPTLESPRLAEHVYAFSGVRLEGPEDGTGGGIQSPKQVSLIDDGDTLMVDGMTLQKPFVEKPVSGEDHNIFIYFPKSHDGGGGRRLFRKIGNKSSEWDKTLVMPRAMTDPGSSFLYEKFLRVDNAEDIKAYTVGTDYCHAETRTSPVVDGVVRRNTHGKEIRYICNLSAEEKVIASKVAQGFGQQVCGFDMLRVGSQSYVIDVNGWSFVKDNNAYYDQCASILKQMFIAEKQRQENGELADAWQESAPKEKKAEDSKADHGLSHLVSSHRSVLKNIMRSPSMSKLRGRHPLGHHSHHTGSPELSGDTVPFSSPPTFESDLKPIVPPTSAGSLPSPFMPPQTMGDTGDATSTLTEHTAPTSAPEPALKHSWKLKGMVSVIRHADRTPKQKFKFTFHTQPFINLLKGHQEEVLLKGESALDSVMDAVKVAIKEGIEDSGKLQLLKTSLARKGAWTGTKVQIKPMFRKRKPEEITKIESNSNQHTDSSSIIMGAEMSEEPEEVQRDIKRPPGRSDSLTTTTLSRYSAAENDLVLDKLQLIIKWGGEPTHSARYQSQDLGENMRADMLLMNKEALEDVHVFSSSERRVSTSAQIWAASFLDRKEFPESSIVIRKDLLDDSNAAKDVMDKVKKKLKLLLREGHKPDPQFAWPANFMEPSQVVQRVTDLMRFHRQVMRYNFKQLNGSAAASLKAINVAGETPNPSATTSQVGSLAQAQNVTSIQPRWCCGEDPELFKERWEKLFSEFCDSEKVDPSKISELYDTMKFDALHNRQFLEWVFTPGTNMGEDEAGWTSNSAIGTASNAAASSNASIPSLKHERRLSGDQPADKGVERSNTNFAHRMGLRRRSVLNPPSPQPHPQPENQESYFKLYSGSGQTRAKMDARLIKLRELYKYAKVLFDFVCPQEYGISNAEKLEIGLLTSLPLLKEIVHDLEEVQASDDAKSFIYFTKESHIYTLLNCILEGGIKTKIERNAIPELDYLSNITFELYESEDRDADTFTYSIRIYITPGCHTFDPLDVQLDSKHSIGCAPRRSLTAHEDWKEVIDTLKDKFQTVKLPKSFLAVNVSDSNIGEAGGNEKGVEKSSLDGS